MSAAAFAGIPVRLSEPGEFDPPLASDEFALVLGDGTARVFVAGSGAVINRAQSLGAGPQAAAAEASRA